jgi:translocator protein
MTYRFIIFLILNFGALAVGGFLMGDAVTGDWYNNLNKAPWTPPGWVFGAAWTVVMISFSFFMAIYTGSKTKDQGPFLLNPMMILFSLQWILNVSWNYIFFSRQLVMAGFADMLLLFVVVVAMMYIGIRKIGSHSLWALPYTGWLVIAASLNGYILLCN